MVISRRNFIHAGCTLAATIFGPSIVERAEAESGPNGRSASTGFNGGVTETNASNAQLGGVFPFINFMKTCQEIFYLRPPSDPAVPKNPILELDPDGYPNRIVPGTGGYGSVFSMPTAAEYADNWVLKWDGTGTVGLLNFSFRVITSVPGRILFKRNGSDGSTCFQVNTTKPAPDHVRNIRLCRSIDEAAMDAGAVFYPPHLAMMKSAKPGAIRSLGWGGGFDGTNTALTALWAQRRPAGYITYQGYMFNPNWFGGTTTSSGSDYTLSYSGYSLADKSVVQLIFNASHNSSRFPLNWSASSGQPVLVNWPAHGLAVGNTVTFGDSIGPVPPSALNPGQTYFIRSVPDAHHFTLAASPGGPFINARTTASGSMYGIVIPRININDTGLVPITTGPTPVPTNVFLGYGGPSSGSSSSNVSTIEYDLTTGWFHLSGGGLMNGGPPEVFVDYCAAVGANPWMVAPFMSVEPIQDYMPRWVSYAKKAYPWMKPIIEPPNETWNGNAAGLSTFYAHTLGYKLWNVQNDIHNSYGKWCSTLGQAISAIYSNDRTKYSMVCAVQTGSFHGGVNTTQDPRLRSTLYVSVNGGSPAYNWVDRVCGANYYSPARRYTCQELIDAYAWSVTEAGNPSAQSMIANDYAATANNGVDTIYTLTWVNSCFIHLKAWAQGMPAGNTIAGIVCYEGGWSPDYLSGNWSTGITGATNTNPCVLTLAPTSSNSETSGLSGNPAVVGMQIMVSGLTGEFANYNGRTVNITGVSGNLITTSLDATAQQSTFVGQATASYVNSMKYSNNLRLAGGSSTAAGTINTQMYAIYFGLASAGFTAEYPSNFLYFGSGTVWCVLQPDIYAPPTAQWNSIVAAHR
jgi:hypothetical protein